MFTTSDRYAQIHNVYGAYVAGQPAEYLLAHREPAWSAIDDVLFVDMPLLAAEQRYHPTHSTIERMYVLEPDVANYAWLPYDRIAYVESLSVDKDNNVSVAWQFEPMPDATLSQAHYDSALAWRQRCLIDKTILPRPLTIVDLSIPERRAPRENTWLLWPSPCHPRTRGGDIATPYDMDTYAAFVSEHIAPLLATMPMPATPSRTR